jgi:hypothetical protein
MRIDMSARRRHAIRQALSLACLDSALVGSARQGQPPRGFALKRRLDLPIAWPAQGIRLGFEASARA